MPNELAADLPELALLYADCVLGDFHERPSFVEICERLGACEDAAGEFVAEGDDVVGSGTDSLDSFYT